jgi:ABC-type antimicrobial peptide transport system permease subunit
MPAAQFHPNQGGLFLRMRGSARAEVESVRRQLQREMPGASYVTVTPLTDIVGSQTRAWDLGATMFTAFGALALVLAAIGLYSVIAYNVAQRTHELGVRIALGAQVRDVVQMVVREGVTLGVAGVILGTAIALALSRPLKPLLFDESPRDPLVFSAMAVLVLGVTIVASLVPARRAARVDPNSALRAE